MRDWLDKTWNEMASADARSDVTLRKRLPGFHLRLYAVRSPDSMQRGLMLVVGLHDLRHLGNPPASRGFSVGVERPERDEACIFLEESGDSSDAVFLHLAADVAKYLREHRLEVMAIRALVQRLNLWKAFFEACPEVGLSSRAQQGLFGEMWILDSLMRAGCDPAITVSAWVGPTGADQDFQFRGVLLEVKTTIAIDPKLRISNLRQLEPLGDRLFVNLLQLVERQEGGTSLPAKIDQVRRRLSAAAPGQLRILDEQLLEAGYHDAHRDLYEALGYIVEREICLEVGEGFPRIRQADLSPAISDVSYCINLQSCNEFEVDRGIVDQAIKECNVE